MRSLAVVTLLAASLLQFPPTHSEAGVSPAMLRPDFNGDGFDDLAIGSSTASVGGHGFAGKVTVLYGGPEGLSSAGAQLWHQDVPGISDEAQDFDGFGSALAAGDFDGDGFADLAVGVPGESAPNPGTPGPNVGLVHVIYGTPNGLRAPGDESFAGAAPGERMGKTLAVLDGFDPAVEEHDADGFADLAVGAPDAQSEAGMVKVLFGSGDGLIPVTTPAEVAFGSPDSRFGSSLAAGDFSGAGMQLAVGINRHDEGTADAAGAVRMFPSGPLITQDTPSVQNTAETGDLLGSSLAAGDFDGDGTDDLGIGVPGETLGGVPSAGLVNVLYGSEDGLVGRNSDQFIQSIDQVGETFEQDDRFGAVLFAANFGRGGQDDLAVGVPGEELGEEGSAGMVSVLYGSAGGLADDTAQSWHQDSPNVGNASEQDDFLGRSLGAGRFGKRGKSDLAIGVPGEDFTTTEGFAQDAGAVVILYSKKNGLHPDGNQFLHANRPGIPGQVEQIASFGRALYSSHPQVPGT